MRGKPNLAPCRHGSPVELRRTEDHWIIDNDCCESAIDWNRLRLVRAWNLRPTDPQPARLDVREP